MRGYKYFFMFYMDHIYVVMPNKSIVRKHIMDFVTYIENLFETRIKRLAPIMG